MEYCTPPSHKETPQHTGRVTGLAPCGITFAGRPPIGFSPIDHLSLNHSRASRAHETPTTGQTPWHFAPAPLRLALCSHRHHPLRTRQHPGSTCFRIRTRRSGHPRCSYRNPDSPKSLFTSTVQPTLSGCCTDPPAGRTGKAGSPQRPRFSLSRRPTLPRQLSRQPPRLPSSPHRRLSLPLSPPWHRLHSRPPQLTQNAATPAAQPAQTAQATQAASGVAATRTNQTFLSYTSPGWYHLPQYHVYAAEGVDSPSPLAWSSTSTATTGVTTSPRSTILR